MIDQNFKLNKYENTFNLALDIRKMWSQAYQSYVQEPENYSKISEISVFFENQFRDLDNKSLHEPEKQSGKAQDGGSNQANKSGGNAGGANKNKVKKMDDELRQIGGAGSTQGGSQVGNATGGSRSKGGSSVQGGGATNRSTNAGRQGNNQAEGGG
jgi:hypothetical protein